MMWSPHRGLSRFHVACSSELPAPVMSRRNFGDFDRDRGHSRVPAPPAGITAQNPAIAGVSPSPAIGVTVSAPSAMAQTVQATPAGRFVTTAMSVSYTHLRAHETRHDL